MQNPYLPSGARPMPEGHNRAASLRGEKESPRIGETVLDIEQMTLRTKTAAGDVLGIRGRVVSSDCHTVGAEVEHAFFLSRPPYRDAPTEAELAVYFIMQARGCTLADASKTFVDLINKLKTQPAAPWFRGVRCKALARLNTKKTFVNVTWQNIPQTKEDIAARRAALDATPAVETAAPAPAPPAPEDAASSLDDLF